ncbi:MAG: hypothetical protein B7Y39_04235 [Bdellovibrio sp. 28-41-41]|nr:MAG: hypothetical protein B7Y39_04235 [Bdellovibrio sp. 28-41-41]
MNIILLALFGAVGVISRYGLDNLVMRWSATELPLSTFVINCIGSIGIGAMYVASNELNLVPTNIAVLLTVGLLGGFTTFSAYSIQTFQLFEQGKFVVGAAYFIGSPIAGLLCAFVGVVLARMALGAQ